MMKYIIATIITTLFMSGCTTVTPAVTEYKIALHNIESSVTSGGCKKKTLKIAQAFSSKSLMSLDMNYAQGDEKVYIYTQAKWQNTPNQIITAEILKSVRESSIFKTTQNSKSRASSELILEINIEDFMQYYTKDLSASSSKVAISFTLVDTKSNTIVSSKTIKAKKITDSLDAFGGVKALNLALNDVLLELNSYMNEECK